MFWFAHIYYLLGSLFFFILSLFYILRLKKNIVYEYSLTNYLASRISISSGKEYKIYFCIRVLTFISMIFLIGKPQFFNKKTKTFDEGIHIMLALDVSNSMLAFDDLHDSRSRWEVAQKEALSFIEKRTHDAIGLVIFGRYSFCRCPLTHDKSILKKIISELTIGSISKDMHMGTMLSQALMNACLRLQNAKAKSKIVVLLTDGEPTEGDIHPQDAIAVAQKLGIKVYTIGIGNDQGGFIDTGMFGIQAAGAHVNTQLLHEIAESTGGKAFFAKNPKDLQRIYETINTLEKSIYEAQIYYKYYDWFLPILYMLLFLLLLELVLRTFVWQVL